jgi:hypothetical protein
VIISASRRTDIPAFYSAWFMERIRAGYCHVPNPYNPKQVAEVSLKPQDVDVIVFWSKNPAPLLRYLPELDARGYRYYFLYTLNNYPTELEPKVPSAQERIKSFRRLSEFVGPKRVIWRYDPIIISNRTDYSFHEQTFTALAKELSGFTQRVIISIADFYRKTDRRLAALQAEGYVFNKTPDEQPALIQLLQRLKDITAQHGMPIQTCAEDHAAAGVPAGACIDAQLIHALWGIGNPGKDPYQRGLCGCAKSKDIGINNTCLHGCPYCYATCSDQAALANFRRHEVNSTRLIGPSLTTTVDNA